MASPQAWLAPFLDLELMQNGFVSSAFYGEDFFACGGVSPVHAFRGVAWCIVVPGFPQAFRALHRLISRIIEQELLTYPRIEAYIDPEFPQAVRWAELLGFRQEGELKPYFFPDGRTGAEWVRLRGGGDGSAGDRR